MSTPAKFTVLMAVAIGGLVAAPGAAASPENDFCRSLASAGVPGDCATVTGLAREVCAQLDRGVDVTAVAERLDAATKNADVSNFIVAGARLYFCPEPRQA